MRQAKPCPNLLAPRLFPRTSSFRERTDVVNVDIGRSHVQEVWHGGFIRASACRCRLFARRFHFKISNVGVLRVRSCWWSAGVRDIKKGRRFAKFIWYIVVSSCSRSSVVVWPVSQHEKRAFYARIDIGECGCCGVASMLPKNVEAHGWRARECRTLLCSRTSGRVSGGLRQFLLE